MPEATSNRIRFRAVVWAFAGLLLPAARLAGESNLYGRWDLTLHGRSGETGGWLELSSAADGPRLRLVPRVGGVKTVREFELRDGRLTFSTEEWFGRYERVVYELRLEGGKLVGEAARSSGPHLMVSGVRAPVLHRQAPKAWGRPVTLFNGTDLAGWQPTRSAKPSNWSVPTRDVLTNVASGPNLRTIEEFEDFKLDAEFLCPEGGNSGIFLRGRYEIAINEEWGRQDRPPLSRTGAIYQFLAPIREIPDRPGQWRRLSATLVNRTVSIVLDGVTIIREGEIPGPTSGGFNAHEEQPGPIILQGDHGPISFRRLLVTPALREAAARRHQR